MERKEGIVVFYDTHDAIKADNICMLKKIEVGLIPTHPDISLGCGFMLKSSWNDLCSIVKVLEEENISYKALYYSIKKGIKREVELLYENNNF